MANQIDVFLSQIGNGKWNIFHFVLVSIASGMLAPFAMAGAFVVPRLQHTCRRSTRSSNDSYNGIEYLPSEDNDTNPCSYFTRTSGGRLMEELCTDWDYDKTIFTRTFTSEFDLVCDKAYIRALYMSLYMLGVLVASPALGYVSDRYGRKKTFVTGVLSFVCLSHLSGWLPNVTSILICRFLIGMTHVPVVKISYIIGMETACPELRSLYGILLYLPWSIFTISFGGIAYLVRDWRWLLTYSSFISLLLVPALWFIDESPHWLAVRGQYNQALQVLKKAARWNRSTLPPDEEIIYRLKEHNALVTKLKTVEEKKNCSSILKENVKGLFILFRTPRLRIISSVLHLSFFAVGMIYYGLSFSGGSFKINIFSYMVLCGITELPSTLLLSPIVARVGRKRPYIIGLFSTGLILLCVPLVPSDQQWLVVTLSLVGRMTVCIASSVIYLFGSELFPTEVRTRGITYSFMMSRVGSSIAPFITEYLAYSYKWAPSVVFGGVAFMAGLASMALRETLGNTLPDTVEFLEHFDFKKERKDMIKAKQKKNQSVHPDTKGNLIQEKIQMRPDP